MSDELARVLNLNTTPNFVIVVFYVGAAIMLAMTGWAGWASWQSRSTIGLVMFFAFASAASAMASQANERLAVNRVINKVRAVA